MNLEYNPNENRTAELLQYLVEKKLENANKIFEEYKQYPNGPAERRMVALTYIDNLYKIKNMYKEEVIGLDAYTRSIALNVMEQYNVSSNEVNRYIESNLER